LASIGGIVCAAYKNTPPHNAADFLELAENCTFLDRKHFRAFNETADWYKQKKIFSDNTAWPDSAPVQTAVLYGFGDVFHGDVAAAGKVGDGAGDLENAAVSAGGQAQLVDGGFQKTLRVLADTTEAFDVAASHLGVAMEL
jgi:hypothetical protein